MENAVKALIMAGSVLISILVISILVFVMRKGGIINSEFDSQISDRELAKFNSQFEIYQKDDNTFFDIITLSNLAWDINKKYNFDEQNSVKLTITINKGTQSGKYYILSKKELNKNYFFTDENGVNDQKYMYDLVSEYTAKKDDSSLEYKYYFKCEEITYENVTGKVNYMKFTIVEN